MASKYFDGILAARKAGVGAGGRIPFDFDKLAPGGLRGRIGQRLTDWALPKLLWFWREFRPVASFGGFYWITRRDDVLAVLADHESFGVPYGLEMHELSDGADFVLGLDGPGQQRQNAIIRRVIVESDLRKLRDWSAAFAESLIEGGAGRLDVVGDFAVRIPTEICRRYFGLGFGDPNSFADWSLAVSAMLFADPTGDPVKREQGLAGAARLRHVIDAAIIKAKQRASASPLADATLVERLVDRAAAEPALGLTDKEIRAIVLGLVVGFIPTNGLAAANMIEALFARPDALAAAKRAAGNGDGEAMRQIVLEAGRLNPALSPGQWRVALTDAVVGTGKWYKRTIPTGATVMVATASAMRDRRHYRAPGRFDPDARNDASLLFGHATHYCLGERLATAIITEMFLILFRQPKLRRARDRHGAMERAGYFPRRLDVEYDALNRVQTMIMVSIPLDASADVKRIEPAVNALGNPACAGLAAALDATGIVHFASCSLVAGGDNPKVSTHLLLELNVDGPRDEAIACIVKHAGSLLEPAIRLALPRDARGLVEILRAHCLDLHFKPWGATGLNFFGTGDLPVASIARQATLRATVERELAAFLGEHGPLSGLGNRAMLALNAVRRAIKTDPALRDLDAFLVKPLRKEFLQSKWRAPLSRLAPLGDVLRAGLGRTLAILFVSTWLICGVLCSFALSSGDESSGASELVSGLGHAALVVMLSLIMTLLVWAAVIGICWGIFRWVESREEADDRPPELDKLEAISAREDAPGHNQNHIIAVTPLKRGIVRRLALAFSLWGIRQSLHWFRPGFVVTMGTIHYAKWFRLPGTDKLIFQSNYDGSWESYLEDFITRAHPGQTAAWSNGVGFPKSKNLVDEGAKDGDRFKPWVRRQQIPTASWYSRFPTLTTKEMRINALIHDGLVRADTDTSARAWLDLLGAAQRQPHELESLEIQSLVFRALKRALFTACIPLKLPDAKEARGAWLAEVKKQLSFGKFPQESEALYLALSAAGLQKLGRNCDSLAGPVDFRAAFSGAFAIGMANRTGILGDSAPAEPDEPWLWTDAGETALAADAVLLVYAPTRELLDARAEEQVRRLLDHGGAVVHDVIRTVTLGHDGDVSDDPAGEQSYEHFRFRDGISTPIIRGTEKFSPREDESDVVEPGEFILGYRNNQGYFAPGVMVPASSDTGENLPVAADAMAFGFADFCDDDARFASRDFSRNGSYLVIRQLAQDAAGFDAFADAQAAALNSRYRADRLKDTVGDTVDGAWFAAKMMGRWRDGRPLIGNPRNRNAFSDEIPDNGFSYGRDDPRGQACPLGAHIRRTNPRDSLEPDDPLERTITRRHLMLRRGRAYFYDRERREYPMRRPDGAKETGLLFIALCADLERQFELVQQSWLGFPSFHGLSNEPDPIATRRRREGDRSFTIPTASGPLIVKGMESFVEMRGGGYFFLPSRSAIEYLANFSRPVPVRTAAILSDRPPAQLA